MKSKTRMQICAGACTASPKAKEMLRESVKKWGKLAVLKFSRLGWFQIFLVLILTGLPGLRAAAPMQVASFYGEEHRGDLMADGSPFNPDLMTCASWFYPLGTKIRVIHAGSGKSVVVTVTDRGPNPRLVRQGRVVDLSEAAFKRLGKTSQGLVPVRVMR